MNASVVARRPWGGFAWVTLAYVVATLVAAGTLSLVPADWHVLAQLATADLAATVTIFCFSRAFDNSSLYDAYWSVAPALAALWLTFGPGHGRGFDLRQELVLTLVGLYAIRLTWNWARGWEGLTHEDWRYVDFRRQMPRGYWLFSLAGLHFFPTVMVLLGLLPLYWALVIGSSAVWWLDLAAALVTGVAIVIEGVADNQLRAFRADSKNANRICDVGLWATSRHPNYFGEILFWVGLLLFGLAGGAPLWAGVGALTMVALFVGASIPMSEKRSLARRPAYAEHQRRVSMLVPWFPPKNR